MLTTQVASYSILTIQLLVVCLTLVRWTTIDAAKALTSQQKEKPHGKKIKTHGKKNTPTAKRKRLAAKFLQYRDNILIHISFAVRSWLFFFPGGYSFCREVILFAGRLFFLPWGYSFCRKSFSFSFWREPGLFFLSWGFSFCRATVIRAHKWKLKVLDVQGKLSKACPTTFLIGCQIRVF